MYSGSSEIVELLLSRGGDIEAGAGSEEGTPLYLAAWLGKSHLVESLIRHGAHVNVVGGLGRQPLQAACSWGFKAVAEKLLKSGADVNVSGGCDGSAICAASNRGDEKLVSLLLECGASINVADKYGWTALHVASQCGHENVAKVLLLRKANINARTEDGLLALHLAAIRMHEEVVRLFLQYEIAVYLDLADILSAIDALECSWDDFCENGEITDEDDIAHFTRVQDRAGTIWQLLFHAAALVALPWDI